MWPILKLRSSNGLYSKATVLQRPTLKKTTMANPKAKKHPPVANSKAYIILQFPILKRKSSSNY
jgi:hypothetical protein